MNLEFELIDLKDITPKKPKKQIKEVFKDEVWCLTGNFLSFKPRFKAENLIKKHGGSINKHLSSKVTHVLYNSTTSFKYRQAKRTGIITLSESQFIERLKQNGIEIC